MFTGDYNVAFVAIFIAVALLAGVLIARSGYFTRNREETNDPRRNVRPNDTNYNQNMYDEGKIESMTKEEARKFKERVDKGELSALSPRDFAALKRKLAE